ncbi:hypothetical protein V1227_07530 [Lentzea sp. DG1S-22]|uniref:hypothetical protein n=1 Tax=Lentzea sp. DG1S-22 TaxID=3108822 RepID=UPI002E762C6E|nr:hypothetical protein [Lentzea sp. DG1S-22]WVH82596.1 hypothetical protein V1227_07530 [Lentzea sp. DG1S-22]
MGDEGPQVVLGAVVGMAAQHPQALPRHHAVPPRHVRQRRRALPAHLEAVVVQRPRHAGQHGPRVGVRQGQADHRHPRQVLVAVQRRVDVLGARGAHHRGVAAPVQALAPLRAVQQEPPPAVRALTGARPVRGQVAPHGGGVGAGGRGEHPAQRQHVRGIGGPGELAQHSGRAAQVVPRQRRERRRPGGVHPAVRAAPADLGGRQAGPVAGVSGRDHPAARGPSTGTAASRARV